MPEAKTDDTTIEDDPKEVSGIPPTLDQVHQMNQAKLEGEDANENQGNEDDDASGAEDDTADGSNDGDDADDASGDAGEAEPTEPTEDKGEPATPEPPAVAATVDSDITQKGEGKIPIKDAEGKTYYFNNRDEVPEDFEPANYKALMDASTLFARKETKDEAAQVANEAREREDVMAADTKARTEAMQKSWQEDITKMTTAGILPKDTKKNEAAADEVYAYIESEMKTGNIITSFSQAYKGMMYDREQAKRVEDQKKIDEDKKKRGGMVQSGSGGTGTPVTGARGNRVIEAPPVGAGLDAVHRRAVEQLETS